MRAVRAVGGEIAGGVVRGLVSVQTVRRGRDDARVGVGAGRIGGIDLGDVAVAVVGVRLRHVSAREIGRSRLQAAEDVVDIGVRFSVAVRSGGRADVRHVAGTVVLVESRRPRAIAVGTRHKTLRVRDSETRRRGSE